MTLFLTDKTTLATTGLWLETPARALLIAFLCISTSKLGLVVVEVTIISCLLCSSSFLCFTVVLAVLEVVVVVLTFALALAVAMGLSGGVVVVAVASA